jgi:ABC-type nickel/cobalt efflux system permease component RcnA
VVDTHAGIMRQRSARVQRRCRIKDVMDATLLTTAGVGFVLGLRHALDPDHLVAVSTLVSEGKRDRRTPLIGGFWGLGHAATLLAGSAVVLALKLSVTDAVAGGLETIVAIMLVVLGVRSLRAGLRGVQVHAHSHAHDGVEHVHLHAHPAGDAHPAGHAPAEAGPHRHPHLFTGGLRPFAVGLVHGRAGAAGVALLAVGAARTAAEGLLYAGMLGCGALVAMLALTTLLSLPLDRLRRRFATLQTAVQLASGMASAGLGLWMFGVHAAESLVRR